MRQKLSNIYRLGVKELWSIWRDPVMLFLMCWSGMRNSVLHLMDGNCLPSANAEIFTPKLAACGRFLHTHDVPVGIGTSLPWLLRG